MAIFLFSQNFYSSVRFLSKTGTICRQKWYISTKNENYKLVPEENFLMRSSKPLNRREFKNFSRGVDFQKKMLNILSTFF